MNQQQPNEIWKDIVGFEGYYQVSNLGQIKRLASCRARRERIRVPYPAPNGYMRLVLSANNRRRTVSIHREVACAFIPNPNALDTVNHLDFDKNNNTVSNLEWLSASDNIKHSCDGGKHFRKAVVQKDLTGNVVKVWESAFATEKIGYKATNVSACCRGKKKTYKNHKWEFYDQD